ncbi:MAG: DNA cytosine methyltransferase, partial [Sphaerospermopsis sp. SIO1G2]|nr:DNA cytosine methyltransferase [Sphaerospermopsis sp. SIO1G2]
SIEYGVPQDRERIILIGVHRNLIQDKLITDHTDNFNFPWLEYIKNHKNKILAYPWLKTEPFQENSVTHCPENIPQELTVEYWFLKNNVVHHPNGKHYFQPRSAITKFTTIDEGDDSRKSFKRLHRWRYSPTACYGNNEVHLHPYKIRRISVAEALAIQSLPANFILPENMSLTNMFKTVGNGVPYLASQALAQSILGFLNPQVNNIDLPSTIHSLGVAD